MEEQKVYKDLNFLIICADSLLGFMMVALVSPAFPIIVRDLGVARESVGLLITVVTLPALLLTPVGGILSDRFGRKRILVPSIIIFGLAGGLCSFAPDFNTLLVLRFIQGIGAAPIFNTNLVVISDIFSGHRRAEAMGINVTVSYIGYIIYPILGGALASAAWQLTFVPFFLAVPLGIFAHFKLGYDEPRNTQAMGEYLKASLKYLKNVKVAWLFLAAVVTYIPFYGGFLTYFNLFMAGRFQASPLIIGLLISLVGIVIGTVSFQAGRINRRFFPTAVLAVSFVLYALTMFLIPALPGIWWCILPIFIIGIAHGLNSPSIGVIGSGITPPEYRAGFMAAYGTMINLGMTIAPLVTGLAFTFSNQNFDTTFIVAGLISLLVPVSAIIIGQKRLPLK
jgi:MFS transporter, ACDE family, multidrug resistance protein